MRTYAKFGIGALVLGLMALPGLARAQEHRVRDLEDLPSPMEALRSLQNTGRMAFMMADVNHDGQVSLQEAIDVNNLLIGGFFFRADADGNGTVTREEMKGVTDKYLNQNPWMRYVVESLRAQAKQKNAQNSNRAFAFETMAALLDSNGDKQIQATELRQMVQTTTQSFFAAADTNRDNQLSPSEANASVTGAVRAIAQASFQQADDDNNGQLSRAEYDKAIVEPANVAFQILDLNHDGQLSQQELQQFARAIANQIRLMQVPEPANSPTNLIESGKLPREAAPIPNFTTPAQNRPQPAPPR
jgi:Ca2+-binding EF-hand superfamily protein